MFASIVLSLCAGFLGGAICLVTGVWGVEKRQNRHLDELQSDVESIRIKQNSFQKTVAGKFGQGELKASKTIEEEAKKVLAASDGSHGNGKSDQDWLDGG